MFFSITTVLGSQTEIKIGDTDSAASTKITSHSSTFTTGDSTIDSRTDYYEYDESGNITGIFRDYDG